MTSKQYRIITRIGNKHILLTHRAKKIGMILLIKLIILKSYFVERDRNIRAILEFCNKLPDWNLVEKHVMEHIWKRLTS